MILKLAITFFASLFTLGCTTPPLRPVDVLLNPPTSITVTGGTNLPDREIHIGNADEIKRITKLISGIRGITVSRLNFDLSEIECLTITIHQGAESTELTMAIGRMVVPDIDDTLFYESKNNPELWELMVSYLEAE